MIVVSNEFKTAMKQPIKELDAYIQLEDNSKITSADDLINFKISCDTSMCKTAMRKLEIKCLGEHNLLGQWVHVGFGVKLPAGTFEYLDYGSFLVTQITTVKDTGVTTIIGYDKMINTMKEYSKLEITYPISLLDYTKAVCSACSLELGNNSFNIHNDWLINQDLWENISGITYRDILVQIAQVTGSTCIISNDDKVYFKSINNTGEQLTYDNMKKLKLEPMYGEINSVVLGRDPITGEDVFIKDDDSINANGLTEFRIVNNEIVDKSRETAITPIYNSLKGISYYPFEAITEGLGWYEIADNFDIVNDSGDAFNTSLFNFSITVDGSINEILKTVAETKTQTQYQYASFVSKRIRNTEIIVDKQNQTITGMIEKVNDGEAQIVEMQATVDGVSTSVTDMSTSLNTLEQSIATIRETMFKQSEETFEMLFKKTGIEDTLNDVESALNSAEDQLNTMTEYIRFEGAKIILGKSTSQSSLIIENDIIKFMTGGNISAYISENQLYITDSTILNKLQIGYWETKPDSKGNLNTRWVGV